MSRAADPSSGPPGGRWVPYRDDDPLFYEYFDGETGAGLGASHQTGWTALVAKLLESTARERAQRLLGHGPGPRPQRLDLATPRSGSGTRPRPSSRSRPRP